MAYLKGFIKSIWVYFVSYSRVLYDNLSNWLAGRLKMHHFNKNEMETIARYDYKDQCWYIYTNILRHYGALKRRGFELVNVSADQDKFISAQFKGNSKAISFRRQNNTKDPAEEEVEYIEEIDIEE